MRRAGLWTTSLWQRRTRPTCTSCPTPAALTKTLLTWRWTQEAVVCACVVEHKMCLGVSDLRSVNLLVCVTFRQNWPSSKLQVLMWIWSSLMQRWLLCKVKYLLPFCISLPFLFSSHPSRLDLLSQHSRHLPAVLCDYLVFPFVLCRWISAHSTANKM